MYRLQRQWYTMRNPRVVIFLTLCLLLLFPSAAHASWVGDKVNDAISDVLADIFEPIFNTMLLVLDKVLADPANFDSVSFIRTVKNGMATIAFSLLVTTLGFRGLMYMINGTTGANNTPMSDLLARAFQSAVLIVSLPWLLENVILKANAFMMGWIGSVGVDFKAGLKAILFPSSVGLTVTIIFVIWLISLIALLWANAVRSAELIFLYMMGPLIAVSQAGRGEALQIWITQSIAVAFTQSFQFAAVGLSFNLLNVSTVTDASGWWKYLAGIGAIVVAIRGPQFLKQFLYSTGTAGAAGGAAQQIGGTMMYKHMMKGVMKG